MNSLLVALAVLLRILASLAAPTEEDWSGGSVTWPSVISGPGRGRLLIRIETFGQQFFLNVSYNSALVSRGHRLEEIGGGGTGLPSRTNCHYTGTVALRREEEEREAIGWAAVSDCNGLRGIMATSTGYYFVNPLENGQSISAPHIVLRHHNAGDSTRRVLRSSQVSERYVEIAVVADHSMLELHGQENLEAYLHTLMNVVHQLYREPSIGNAINIVVVRTIILESDQLGLSLLKNTDTILREFCSWQSTLDSDHDLAVLVTRSSICESSTGTNCGILGLSPGEVGGVCNPLHSCNINRDSGLSTAFTIAHEIGHNLGLLHDGSPFVSCQPKSNMLMAPSFSLSSNPHRWSECSREQLATFLGSEDSWCLENQPAEGSFFSGEVALPGTEFSLDRQCQLLFGNNASHCLQLEAEGHNECQKLWCQVESECITQHSPPAAGTECTLASGEDGVCYGGECKDYSQVVVPVEGGWGEWGNWSSCSRSCGTGVQLAIRECDSPVPSNGGAYCSGLHQHYQTCNVQPCPEGTNYRQELCMSNPPTSGPGDWVAPSAASIRDMNLDPCIHYCVAATTGRLYTSLQQLPNGAPCLTSHSSGVCVEGECLSVGCEYVLGVDAVVDECGVRCGNGSSCMQVWGNFTQVDHPGAYRYYRAVVIPPGSTHIMVKEVRTSVNSYIAVSSGEHFINGNLRVISGSLTTLEIGGTSWSYERPHESPEYLQASGPTLQKASIYLLTKQEGEGLHFSFNVKKTELQHAVGAQFWEASVWGECEGVCGEGVQFRRVYCMEVGEAGTLKVANDGACELSHKPAVNKSCSIKPCSWQACPWSECTVQGRQERTVYCTTHNGTQVSNANCVGADKPEEVQPCTCVDVNARLCLALQQAQLCHQFIQYCCYSCGQQ